MCKRVYNLHINNKGETMNSKEIIARLQRDGWYRVGGKGDHEKFKHPTKPGHVVVPHPRKDIAIGTLRSIYKQAGWIW
jgi:predicted RNA binding protein YcfA (HicA-like mRNA interferase family)